MRKYVLTVFAFFVHTFVNNSKINSTIKSLEVSDSITENKKIYQKEFDDSTSYIKRGGTHTATWYNPHGARTSSGIKFHRDSLTAAYNFTKLRSYLRVTNIYTNESIIVKVTDRMGYKGQNHIDLSKCAFDSIGNPKSGRIKVIVEEIVYK